MGALNQIMSRVAGGGRAAGNRPRAGSMGRGLGGTGRGVGGSAGGGRTKDEAIGRGIRSLLRRAR